jgi:hypothetical protein
MPRLEVEGAGTFDVEDGKRLVLAIEEDGGWTYCTTSVHNCKNDARFRFRAAVTEDGSHLELVR